MELPPNTPAITAEALYQQSAEKIVNVRKAAEVNTVINITISSGKHPGMQGYHPAETRSLDISKYHLFVVGAEEFDESGYFLIGRDRSMVEESTEESLQLRYRNLSDSALAELMLFPAIFLAETDKHKIKDDSQYVYFGVITNIKPLHENIKIYYRILSSFRISQLVEMKSDLDIHGAPCFGELNHTHWSLKDVNAYDVFKKYDVPVLIPTNCL